MKSAVSSITYPFTFLSSLLFLDIPSHFSHPVVIYECSKLAQGCSSCLGANIQTDFTCGWCVSTTSSCQVNESCASEAFATVSTQCPSPSITGVSPLAGPLSGGTNLTITGTDLGVQASDIFIVTVGGVECVVIDHGYVAGVQLMCMTRESSVEIQNALIIVSVMRSDGSIVSAASTSFSYLQPTIVSVSPEFGPMAGGTQVEVRGTHLDIGNAKETKVQLNERECSDV